MVQPTFCGGVEEPDDDDGDEDEGRPGGERMPGGRSESWIPTLKLGPCIPSL